MKKVIFAWLVVYSAAFTVQAQHAEEKLSDWTLRGFVRASRSNYVISPDQRSVFADPITGNVIDWESNDTFNPGTVLKDGKVVLLYRAEDKTGVKIGQPTSRPGYAESKDGINFNRKKEPVIFPADDEQKAYE